MTNDSDELVCFSSEYRNDEYIVIIKDEFMMINDELLFFDFLFFLFGMVASEIVILCWHFMINWPLHLMGSILATWEF